MTPTSDGRAARIVDLLTNAPDEMLSIPTHLAWLQTGECEGSRHHSPSPLLIRPVYLSSLLHEVLGDQAKVEEDLVYVCSTCRDNITVYLSILYAYDGKAPMAVRRDFGNLIRDLGDRAWVHWKAAILSEPV